MRVQARRFVFLLALSAVAAAPGSGQIASPAGGTEAAALMPDFSGMWVHPYFPGIEPPPSGPGPVFNRLHRPTGGGNNQRFVGDYSNPILKPGAAAIVKQHGDISLSGMTYPTPSNRCWPSGVPYIFFQPGMQMLQQPQQIVFLYLRNHEFRRVRMNQPHPAQLQPSWYGDSVGHYEGDTLVIDTVGVKADRKYAMIDLFGTPYTEKLHVVERYRLRDYDDVKDAIERNIKENWMFNGDVFSQHRGKFLQLHVTIEDEGVFTTPWTATLTYVPGPDQIPEGVCAENRGEYYHGENSKEADVPKAERPDF